MDIHLMVKKVKENYRLQQHTTEWIQFLKYVNKLKPKVIVEIGTASGASALCLSHFTNCIITIDCRPLNNGPAYTDIRKNCELHFIELDTGTKKCIEQLKHFLKGRTIDLLFIDGEHSYRGVKRDFIKFSHLLTPGGIIALHDIVNSDYHRKLGCKVYKFWNELKRKYKTSEFNLTDWGGIGIVKNYK